METREKERERWGKWEREKGQGQTDGETGLNREKESERVKEEKERQFAQPFAPDVHLTRALSPSHNDLIKAIKAIYDRSSVHEKRYYDPWMGCKSSS